MLRGFRFYSALVLAFLVVAVAGRSVAQVSSGPTALTLAPPPLFEGLTQGITNEPPRSALAVRLFGSQPPSCSTVAATTTRNIPGEPTYAAGYSQAGCGAFVIDYTIPANQGPHLHFGGMMNGADATTWGGMKVPSTQPECADYHEEARFWTKPTNGGTFQFRGIARFKGVWVTMGNQFASGSSCWLYGEDQQSTQYHHRINRSPSAFILRVALEARRGNTPVPVGALGVLDAHTHSVLVAP